MDPGEVAKWIRMVAADVRLAGDMKIVRISDEGVAPDYMTLSDEMWLMALCLDGETTLLRDPDTKPEQQP